MKEYREQMEKWGKEREKLKKKVGQMGKRIEKLEKIVNGKEIEKE